MGLPYEDGVEKHFERLGIAPWREFTRRFPGTTFDRAIRSIEPKQLRRLMAKATDSDPTYDPPDLLSYFVVRFPVAEPAEAVIAALEAWPAIEAAYPFPRVDLATVDPSDDPGYVQQGYLNAAPQGIGVGCAWSVQGGDGSGVRFADVEFGWAVHHEDLDAQGITLVNGTLFAASAFHGTAVLGEVCAVDNALGCIGIAPEVASVVVSSIINSTPWDGILACLPSLGFGDVLLVELQITFDVNGKGWNNVVFEAYPLIYDAIRLATALGIAVVECAGNGSNDLDTFQDFTGAFALNRNDPGFKDSGAIIVGAADPSALAHARLGFSNFGSRVDCYAWGLSVYTCASDASLATNLYTPSFSGTSAAGPIVAGAGILVQSIAEANLAYRFSPTQLRGLLSDPANGTPSLNPPVDEIGVMPDLCKLVDDALFVAPDLYLRDFVGDPGDPHGNSFTSGSPDVIPKQATVADPQVAFGPSSGTANIVWLGDPIEAGQDNYLYVRVLNRGGSDAQNVVVTVYWSHSSTLVTPNLWHLIGSDTIPLVPNGNVLTVSNPITWAASDIPGPGHYCFVALIGNADDPAPGPAAFPTINDYVDFIRRNNNAAWRNFDVVNVVADSPTVLPFLVPGAPDIARPMRLEVVARLPRGSRVSLEAPIELRDVLQVRTPYVQVDAKRRLARLPVNPYGSTRLGDMVFAPGSATKMRLLVDIPKDRCDHAYEVYVRQLYEEQEVGRMTWRLAPEGQPQR